MKEIHNTWWTEQNHKCQVTELMPFTSYITVGIIWTEHTCSKAHCLRNQGTLLSQQAPEEQLSQWSTYETSMRAYVPSPGSIRKAKSSAACKRDRQRQTQVDLCGSLVSQCSLFGGLQLGETLTQRNKVDNVRGMTSEIDLWPQHKHIHMDRTV